MKKIYFIRHAKAKKFCANESDFERVVSKKGKKDIKLISQYLKNLDINADIVLSSCALRAQQTTTEMLNILNTDCFVLYLEELYKNKTDEILKIIQMQDDSCTDMFVVGHYPYLLEIVNQLSKQQLRDIPTMGVVALKFDIKSWRDTLHQSGVMEFCIYPKMFAS